MALALLPVFILTFYNVNEDKFDDEEFEEKYGAPYEGLDTRKKTAIYFSLIFIFRRLSYAAISITLYNYVMIQIPLMVILTLFNVFFLVHYSPYDDKLIEYLDIVNDVTTIILIDMSYLFTDMISNKRTQYNVGFVFVALIVVCICIQLFFLLIEAFRTIKLKLKARKYKKVA